MDKMLGNVLEIAIPAVALVALLAIVVTSVGTGGAMSNAINSITTKSTGGATDIVDSYISNAKTSAGVTAGSGE